MRRGLLVSVALIACSSLVLSCWDFEQDLQACIASGRCDGGASGSDAGLDGSVANGGADGGSDGGLGDGGSSAAALHVDCNVEGWCWENPWPTGNDLYAVFSFGPSDVWAAGIYGTLLHWQGGEWVSYRAEFGGADLRGLWGAGPNDLWTVGAGDRAHWNGASWQHYRIPDQTFAEVFGNDAGELWVAGETNTSEWTAGGFRDVPAPLYSLTSRGAGDWWAVGEDEVRRLSNGVWIDGGLLEPGPLPPGGAKPSPARIWASPTGELFVCGTRNTLYRHGSDGGGWTRVHTDSNSADLLGLWGVSSNNYWAVGNGGHILHVVDGGRTTEQDSPSLAGWAQSRLVDIHGTSESDVWAVGNHGTVLNRKNGNWKRIDRGEPVNLYALAFDEQSRPVAVGYAGAHLVRGDGGWVSERVPGLDGPIHDIWAAPGAETVVVGVGLARRPAGSGKWSVAWNYAPVLQSIAGVAGDLWAVGDDGLMMRSDGGAFAEVVPARPLGDAGLWDIARAPSGELWVVGENGLIAHRVGQNWVREDAGMESTLYAVTVTDGGEVWAVGSSAQPMRRSASGQWTTHWPGGFDDAQPTLYDVWAPSADEVWVGGENGLWRYDGSSWTHEPIPSNNGIEAIRGDERGIWVVGPEGMILMKPR